MAKLGASQVAKFPIGTAELRIGPLSEAGILDQSNSIGLIDDATLTVTQESVDLEGGFPRTIVDTAIIRQASTLAATLREFSRRNFRVMLGDGVEGTNPSEVVSTLAGADVAAGASALTVAVGDGALFAADEIVVVYPEGRPEDVSVLQIESIAVDTLTFKTGQTTVADYNVTSEATTTFHIYNAHPVPIGAVTQTQYFSMMLIQKNNQTGRPDTASFWKAANTGSMEYATNAEDFASSTLDIKILEPAVAEYGVGQDLAHLADVIPSNPTGMFSIGADA